MTIRKTTADDFDEICRIYSEARAYMREYGNPGQWKDAHPAPEIVERDIQTGMSYVCVDGEKIAAVFYFNIELDPTYGKIDGQWLNDKPYGVVHRIARDRDATGAAAFCLDWCFEECRNLRIDTHCDNAPMRRLLDKLGFHYCGIIWIENGEERMAFQKAENL